MRNGKWPALKKGFGEAKSRFKLIFSDAEFTQKETEMSRLLGPSVVVIGGGTGLSNLLRGVKTYTSNLTAIVTVSDDGGGSGRLREDMGILPPGDIRNCLMALANAEPTMQHALNHRFREGSLAGQSLGNLFLAAMTEEYNSFVEAVKKTSEVLGVTGRVLPVTTSDIRLKANFDNGDEVMGETSICAHKTATGAKIRRISLMPSDCRLLPEAEQAILEADIIIMGPGSLYTSIIPNLMVGGLVDAIKKSSALRLYICNIMTQPGETDGYSAFEHFDALRAHTYDKITDICVVNNDMLSEPIIRRYAEKGSSPVVIDRQRFANTGVSVAQFKLISEYGLVVRHDPAKLAAAVKELYESR